MFLSYLTILLKKDVKDRIMLKINDVQSYLDWSKFNISVNAADLNLSIMNYDYVIKQQNISEFLVKLSVDLWRDFDYYRQFSFDGRDNTEYTDGLVNLGCVCVDGKWKCADRPSEDKVQENVFLYCLYRLIANEIRGKSIQCSYCDAHVGGSDDKCEYCNASIDEIDQRRKVMIVKSLAENDAEIIVNKINERNVSYEAKSDGKDFMRNPENYEEELNNEQIWKGDNSNLRQLFEKLWKKDKNVRKWEKKEDEKVLVNGEGREKADISKKWQCRGCGLLNEYTFVNCGACEGLCKDGTWSCGGCTMVNKCDNNRCSACWVRNIYLAEVPDNTGTVIDDNKERESNKRGCDTCVIMKDGSIELCDKCRSMKTRYKGRIAKNKWKCGKCELLQGYTDIVCGACRSYRCIAGLWICDKCTSINECYNERCNQCGEYNEYLRKYCDVCRRNRVPLSQLRCIDCAKIDTVPDNIRA